MLKEICIIVDTNDGDHRTELLGITEETLAKILPLIEAIKAFVPYTINSWTHDHNYPTGECLRRDLGEESPEEIYDFPDDVFEAFEDFLPCTDYGLHTIERIEVYTVANKERIL